MSEKPKVFGIGLQKTGTSSFGDALQLLGYQVCRMNFADRLEQLYGCELTLDIIKASSFRRIALEAAHAWAQSHSGFQDTPWFLFYPEMCLRYPSAKFVLTVRDREHWIRSMRAYDRTYRKPRAKVVLEWIYGWPSPSMHEGDYLKTYDDHWQSVLKYFQDKPDRLLVLNMNESRKMEKLCDFLGQTVPRSSSGRAARYPHSNIGRKNRLLNRIDDIKRLIFWQ